MRILPGVALVLLAVGCCGSTPSPAEGLPWEASPPPILQEMRRKIEGCRTLVLTADVEGRTSLPLAPYLRGSKPLREHHFRGRARVVVGGNNRVRFESSQSGREARPYLFVSNGSLVGALDNGVRSPTREAPAGLSRDVLQRCSTAGVVSARHPCDLALESPKRVEPPGRTSIDYRSCDEILDGRRTVRIEVRTTKVTDRGFEGQTSSETVDVWWIDPSTALPVARRSGLPEDALCLRESSLRWTLDGPVDDREFVLPE